MTMMTLTKKRDLDKYAHVHKGKSLRVMTGCTTVFSSNHSYHHDDEVTRHQGYATRCILVTGLRGNGERMRKWRGNGERMRKWREIHSLYFLNFFFFLPLYPSPISKIVSFCRKMLNTALFSEFHQKLDICAMRR